MTLAADPHRNPNRDRTLATSLDWAGSHRATHYALVPQSVELPVDAWTALLGMQGPAPSTCARRHCSPSVIARFEAANPAIRQELELIGAQLDRGPPALIEVPLTWVRPMRTIAANIARQASSGSWCLVDAKLTAVQDAVYAKPVARRSDRLLLPLRASETCAFLDTSSIAKSTFAVVGDLLSATHEYWRESRTAREVLRATRTLVFRGYASGLKAILGRYVPELADHSRLLKHDHEPAVTLTRDCVGVTRVRIAWTPPLLPR
ncbi:MAG: hypothetical protein ACREPF_05595 [Rhodanobacteraceae bacterium]